MEKRPMDGKNLGFLIEEASQRHDAFQSEHSQTPCVREITPF